jgi:hypothetical protein
MVVISAMVENKLAEINVGAQANVPPPPILFKTLALCFEVSEHACRILASLWV